MEAYILCVHVIWCRARSTRRVLRWHGPRPGLTASSDVKSVWSHVSISICKNVYYIPATMILEAYRVTWGKGVVWYIFYMSMWPGVGQETPEECWDDSDRQLGQNGLQMWNLYDCMWVLCSIFIKQFERCTRGLRWYPSFEVLSRIM